MRTAQEIVNAEIHVCLSSLVSTLGAADYNENDSESLASLKDQALELASPIDDWEEAAIQAGWSEAEIEGHYAHAEDIGDEPIPATDWRDLCEQLNLEPCQREVFEHWAVSSWLADKLDAQGEKVDKDFAGLCVWARTTTGQPIYADAVFEVIAAELAK